MNILHNLLQNIKKKLSREYSSNYLQYHHRSVCKNPCDDCPEKDRRIFSNDENKPKVGEDNHPHCDCFYSEIREQPVGQISTKGFLAPDVYLKAWGKLPEYYITKLEAETKYGWNSTRNTLAGKAPGKMIGGDIFYNNNHILPEKEGRIWYECDVDYISGSRRTCSRLYYSNDGLMFFSDHLKDDNITFIN